MSKNSSKVLNESEQVIFFGPKLPKNGFWGRNLKNITVDSESALPKYNTSQFSGKTDNFDIFGPKINFQVRVSKI